MLNFVEISERYENEWLVLDRQQNVIDHGPDLETLWDKYEAVSARLTFYFAAAFYA